MAIFGSGNLAAIEGTLHNAQRPMLQTIQNKLKATSEKRKDWEERKQWCQNIATAKT